MTRLCALALALTGLLVGFGPQTATGESGLSPLFSVAPEAPDVNTLTTLDASASSASGSRIARYEWDLDDDGSFEIRTESPTVTHLFDESGAIAVTLRVTDERDRSATITRTVDVASAPVRVRRTIETPLEGDRVPAGSAIEVTVTIHVNEAVSGLGLDEDLPEGWRVQPSENDGAAYKGSEFQWLWFSRMQPGETRTIIYSATTASSSANRTVELRGTVSSRSPAFEITIPGDVRVRVI